MTTPFVVPFGLIMVTDSIFLSQLVYLAYPGTLYILVGGKLTAVAVFLLYFVSHMEQELREYTVNELV